MRKLSLLFVLYHLVAVSLSAQQHPIAFATKKDLQLVKNSLATNLMLNQSYDEIKKSVDQWIGKEIDVPLPKDPAGGYTHEKHKENYNIMFNAGVLYQITGDVKYALLLKNIFLKYSVLIPTLKNHPEATSSSPGRIFWQALNDANWLVYAGLAFDCIHDYLTIAERKQITDGAFKPEVDYFTKDMKPWFNLIHNHAVWACAGVGIVGIATDNQDYVKMALYGTEKDGAAGFIAHLNGLFSPDGYYNEGPYYTRYAILPFYFLANALNNSKPELGIFKLRNNILQKALNGALQQTNLNGGFYSYNDAIKDKTFISSELVVAIDIAWQVYGPNQAYLPVAKAQGKVILNAGGVGVSSALQKEKNIPAFYPYQSIEFTDGANGNKGGVSVLRTGNGDKQTSMIFKYSSHGMSHGHFDKLNINVYDNGNEILQDYGAARFIGIEQKWGGRYLPESKSYAQQTIAHNTITVDETSHYDGKEAVSELNWPVKLFGSIANKNLQVVSSIDKTAYKDVQLQRTVFMLQLPDQSKPLIIDLFKTTSTSTHQFDLPFNYSGTVISTNFKYNPAINSMKTLGNKNGYQFLWKEAEARLTGPLAQFTFLNEKAFYTISSLVTDSAQIFFTRIGANDPNFNLRRDPSYIFRTKALNPTFLNIIELHGNYSPTAEVANGAYSSLTGIELLQDDANYTVGKIIYKNKSVLVVQSNNNFEINQKHVFKKADLNIEWVGPYAVFYNNQIIK
ncbi:MAG: alginate lyase family protein [Sphingobacteriia bacterium]|jgi:hypothetical protein